MTYLQACDYLDTFVNYERLNVFPYPASFKLARTERLLALLGNPQRALHCLQVAGSKGKGSTCVFIAQILKAAGLKVGLYTSPHLIEVRERMRILRTKGRRPGSRELKIRAIDNDVISENDFARLVARIRPYAEQLRKTRWGELSYYEILTSVAFLYFKEEQVDFAVLETGIGGRLDATNVVTSLVCAIAPVSYEHTQVLGNTLGKIAQEKAGIIKDNGQIVITAPQRPTALKVIRRRAKAAKADLIETGKDIQLDSRFKIGLLGEHQRVNAAVAVACVRCLSNFGFQISQSAIKQGLRRSRWPGRLQIFSRRPRIILDAAQNRASAVALRQALVKLFKFRRLILVFGASGDKDVRGMLKELGPCAWRIILTKTKHPRAMEPAKIKSYIKKDTKSIVLTEDVRGALKIARQNVKPDTLVLVAGSLFLVAEVLKSQNEKFIIR